MNRSTHNLLSIQINSHFQRCVGITHWCGLTRQGLKKNSYAALFKSSAYPDILFRTSFYFSVLGCYKIQRKTDENLQTKYYKFMGERQAT